MCSTTLGMAIWVGLCLQLPQKWCLKSLESLCLKVNPPSSVLKQHWLLEPIDFALSHLAWISRLGGLLTGRLIGMGYHVSLFQVCIGSELSYSQVSGQ